ncbi:hypothetical protein YPPY32_1840, partial [Yersinia pestis PY-32]
MHAIYRNINE